MVVTQDSVSTDGQKPNEEGKKNLWWVDIFVKSSSSNVH